MKTIILALFAVAVLSAPALAQTPKAETPAEPGKKAMACGEMMQKKAPGMPMGMMAQKMAMQNVMRTLQDMARIQDRILAGVTEDEKKALRQELKGISERMEKMMLDAPKMMRGCQRQAGGHQHGAPAPAAPVAAPEAGKEAGKVAPAAPQEHRH